MASKKTEVESNEENVVQTLSLSSAREIVPIGLILERSRIEGVRVKHRLLESGAFNVETLSKNEFPTVRSTSKIVTDLMIAIRTSPLVIDELLDEQDEKALPKGVRIEVDADEDDDEGREDMERAVIVIAGAGECIVAEDEGPLAMYSRFLELDKTRNGKLSDFVERMNGILDSLSKDEPMVIGGMKGLADDEMLSSPAGKAALMQSESTEARRAAERREGLLQKFMGGLHQLSDVLGFDKTGGVVVSYTTHQQLGDYINASYQNAIGATILVNDV